MDILPLQAMVQEWLGSEPKDLERSAFLKDALGLVSLCHKNPQTLRIQSSQVADGIVGCSLDLKEFL